MNAHRAQTRDLDPSFSLQVFEDIVHVIRTPLTRNIEIKFHDVRDEIIAAFSDHIPTTSDGNNLIILFHETLG